MHFDKAFVITLPFRSDRLESFRKQTANFSSLSEITEWPAIHGDTCHPPAIWKAGNGAWGCYKSHLNILEYCLSNAIASYIVFEDDAQFKPEFDKSLNTFMEHLPEDWQQIYLGGELQHENSHPPVKINDAVYRPYNVNRTHCFAVSRTGMLPIYQHICNLPFHDTEHIDHHLGRWHEDPINKVYCPPKWLVGQMGFTSNVSGKNEAITYFSDPVTCALTHQLYDNPVCVVFRGSYSLLRQAKHLLHGGNQIDAHGYDITLTLAAKCADPIPEIARWYGWIRSEIVRSRSKALPCMFHPRISIDQLKAAGITSIYEITPKTLEDIEKALCSL
jgi:GR25 family glycosyltransferase involved in LPS biosynthesis